MILETNCPVNKARGTKDLSTLSIFNGSKGSHCMILGTELMSVAQVPYSEYRSRP